MSKKKDDTVSKLPGLHQRNGVYQLRMMVPEELQSLYKDRAKFSESLKLTDRVEANITGTARRAYRLAEFDRQRKLPNREVKGREGAKRYTLRDTGNLKRAIDALAYPGLVLPREYRRRPNSEATGSSA